MHYSGRASSMIAVNCSRCYQRKEEGEEEEEEEKHESLNQAKCANVITEGPLTTGDNYYTGLCGF